MVESSFNVKDFLAKCDDPAYQATLPPRERTVTMPAGIPEYTLGYQALAWIENNLRIPDGKKAGAPFECTLDQALFLLWFYAVDDKGEFVYRRGVRRLAKGPIAHDTLIVTPDGVRRHGDLRVGDEVYAVDGSITRVIELGDEVLEDCYRVFFRGGGSVVCTGSHRFPVNVFKGRGRVAKIVTVREMMQNGLVYERALTRGKTKATKGGVSRYTTLPTPAVQGRELESKLDPWLFGMWLGDGDKDCPRITCGNEDVAWVESRLNRLGVEHSKARTNTAWRVWFGKGWAKKWLRDEGVLNNKHIPERWFTASLAQRRALMQGLIDSDGSISENGACEFSVTNLRLADDVMRLAVSLGLMPSRTDNDACIYGRKAGVRAHIRFMPLESDQICLMPRKLARVKTFSERQHKTLFSRVRVIERIEPVATVPARCITVAHPSHQYLVGEHMVPTCNSGKSPFAAALALFELLGCCRFAGFDTKTPGGVVGKPDPLPLVQLAATSESQTGVTMRTIIGMANKRTRLAQKYELDVGRTYIYTPTGGRLQLLTSSSTSAEGWAASFIIADELEHWTGQNGGKAMYETMRRNLAKTGARMLETCNAWIPATDCVAEASFNDWCDQQEGKIPLNVDGANTAILYDARIAPANTALTDTPQKGEISLTDGLNFVYKHSPWAAIGAIKGEIWTPSTPVSASRRFYLNQPNAATDSWVNLADWAALADPDRGLVDGEEIVLFFDGSKSNDHTALVGCCMSDGFIFTLGVWAPEKVTGVVSTVKVDNTVREAFKRFTVVAFWADVREWESFVKSSWVEEFGESLILPAVASGKAQALIAWDMRTHQYDFALASEQCRAEIQDGKFKHDGNWETSRHIGNCREVERRGFITVRKESPKSPNKIDAAVCVIGARMVYRAVLASAQWEAYQGNSGSWAALGW